MVDIAKASDVFTTMLHAIDAKDWDGVRQTFADTLEMDYSSLSGAPPAMVRADDQVAEWRAFTSALDATQHITGPIVSTAESGGAVARTPIRAYHQAKSVSGGDIWMVAGHYKVRFVLRGNSWKIAGITLTVFYQEGNTAVAELARARARTAR